MPVNNVPASVEAQAERLTADLTAQGYEVARGYFRLYTHADCVSSFSQMKTCYGNNPAAPYVLVAVPSWPNEFVDPATNLAFGELPAGYSGSFRLDPREAIVIFGMMPPPAAYYGLQTYVFTREGTFDTSSQSYQFISTGFPAMLGTFFSPVPENPARIQIATSLSNSNNDVVVQEQSGAAFDVERFFISTPDASMDSAVRASLAKLGVESTAIFTEPVPSAPGELTTVRTGLDEHADDLLWLMRYAMPADGGGQGSPSDTWRQDLPLVVLRVRDTAPWRPVETYGPVVLEARIAVDEMPLQADLASLVAAVNSRWGQPCSQADCSDQGTTNFMDLQSPPINFVGPSCMQVGMNCLADTQDTTYQAAVGNLLLDDGEIYAVAGTLGTMTGNATYVGISINDSVTVEGVANVSSDELKDTALSYAGQVNNADKFYVYYFARDCSDLAALTDGHCLSITEAMIPLCSDPATQACHSVKIAQRDYVVPGTRRGPDPTLTLLPRLLKLKRR